MTEDRGRPPRIPRSAGDPGLASERTRLAWTRSSLAFAGVGIAVLKLSPAVGIPILAFGAVVWTLGQLLRPLAATQPLARRALLVTIAVTALAVVALALTLAGPRTGGIRLR